MFDLILETAKVVSIEDKDKQGKIQINIESKSKNIKKEMLPWAIPLFSNICADTMNMDLPSVNSQVWILVDKYYKRFYYLTNRYFYNLFDFSKVSGLLDKCDKINKDYKNIAFRYFKDKTLVFHNNEDGSSGIITSQGTVIYINKDGDLIKTIQKNEIIEIKGDKEEKIYGKNKIEINDSSEIKIKGKDSRTTNSAIEYNAMNSITLKSKSNGLIDIGNKIGTIGSVLTELCKNLSNLTTVGSPTTQKSPILSAQMATLLPKIKMIFK